MNIAGWSEADLRRFVVNLLANDPGAIPQKKEDPRSALPDATGSDGAVPVWDANAQRWLTSTQHPVPAADIAAGSFLRLLVTGTDRKVAFGTTVITFNGASIAASINVTHGLGATPQVVLTTPQQQSGLNAIPATEAGTYGSTTFNAQAWTIDAQVPVNGSTATVAWLAIA